MFKGNMLKEQQQNKQAKSHKKRAKSGKNGQNWGKKSLGNEIRYAKS